MGKGVDGVTIAFFCHDGEGHYVFNKRSNNCRDEHGRWDNGGGKLDFGLTVERALYKEVSEEYGATPIEHEFLGYRDILREQGGYKTHWLALDFRVLVDRSQVINGEPHKFDEIGWFRMDNLPAPLHSQVPFGIDKYQNVLV